jgi:hypothetical protein
MIKRIQEDRALMVVGLAAACGFSITLATILAAFVL